MLLNLYVTNSHIHNYVTRIATNYRMHLCCTNLKQFTILYQGPKFGTFFLFQSLIRQTFLALRQKCKSFYLNIHWVGLAAHLKHFPFTWFVIVSEVALLEAWWVARSPLLLTINAGNKILYFENKADRRKDDDTMYKASLYLIIFIIPPCIHYSIIKSSKWGFILNLCLLCATKATRASFCAVKASLCCWDSAVYYALWFLIFAAVYWVTAFMWLCYVGELRSCHNLFVWGGHALQLVFSCEKHLPQENHCALNILNKQKAKNKCLNY